MYANRQALQTAIINETVRTGDTAFSGMCLDFIKRAERRIYTGLKPLRCREMETRETVTFTAGVGATPAGFLSARRLTWQASRPYGLIYRTPEEFYDLAKSYGQPMVFTIDGTVIDIASPATGTAVLSYYKRPVDLAGDLDTNTVLSEHGHVYLAAALIEAYHTLDNPQKVGEWTMKFMEAVEGVNLAATKARYSGTHLAPRIPGAV
jgi:hypothetical protein